MQTEIQNSFNEAKKNVFDRIWDFMKDVRTEALIFAVPTVSAFAILPSRVAVPVALGAAAASGLQYILRDDVKIFGRTPSQIATTAVISSVILGGSMVLSLANYNDNLLPTGDQVGQVLNELHQKTHNLSGQTFAVKMADGKSYTLLVEADDDLHEGQRTDVMVSTRGQSFFNNKKTTDVSGSMHFGPKRPDEIQQQKNLKDAADYSI